MVTVKELRTFAKWWEEILASAPWLVTVPWDDTTVIFVMTMLAGFVAAASIFPRVTSYILVKQLNKCVNQVVRSFKSSFVKTNKVSKLHDNGLIVLFYILSYHKLALHKSLTRGTVQKMCYSDKSRYIGLSSHSHSVICCKGRYFQCLDNKSILGEVR